MEENFNSQESYSQQPVVQGPVSQGPFIQPQKESQPKPRKLFLLILIAGIVALGFYFWNSFGPKEQKGVYTETYRLTPEKISQSAMIRVYLPPKVDKESVKNNIKFTPEIKGQWAEEKGGFWTVLADENILYFKPDGKLELNNYYLATLITS